MQWGTDWHLTPQRVALHLPTATAVLADVHLGYHRVRRHHGEAVPLVGLDSLLPGLQALIARETVQRLLVAGDLTEDGRQAIQELAEFRAWLDAAGIEFLGVVPGNHDRTLAGAGDLPIHPGGFTLGEWLVVHGDRRLPPGRIVHGHVHPCFCWGQVTSPCYLLREDRLILPAFSAEAAGLDVLARRSLGTYGCAVIAGDRVLDFGRLSSLPRQRQKTFEGSNPAFRRRRYSK